MFDPVVYIPLGLAMVVIGIALPIAIARTMRARRRARRRVVEKPNSHYTSQLVRQNETRHRWHDIDLDRIHEINREEVVRLLAKLEATSIDALRPNERIFLDHMAKVAGKQPQGGERREKERGPAPDLRHRPA